MINQVPPDSIWSGMAQVTEEVATEHPHVVRTAGIRGSQPHLRGTGLSVGLIARFYKLGAAPDELLATYPQLTPAALFDALSYYHDHQGEIDHVLAETDRLAKVQAMYGFSIGERGQVIFANPQKRGSS